MKRYSSYKDSGVEWIGEIPRHWDVSRIKYLTIKDVQYGLNIGSDSYSDDGFRFIRTTDINENGKLIYEGVYIDSMLVNDEYKLDYLDFLISRSGTLGRTFLNLSNDPQCFAGYLVRFNFGDLVKSKYINYYFHSSHFFDWMSLNTIVSTIGNINGQKYSNMEITFPPLPEQKQIVQFLDTKTVLIDTLIEKTQRKIELLKEKRTSLINHTVTKGLNHDVEMKDSGVEWIGEIPRHWDRIPFKYEIDLLTDFTSNGSFKSLKDNVEYLEYGYSRLVRLTDLRVDLENNGVYISEESHNFLSKSELFGGEILISCVGHYTGFVTKMLYGKGNCSLGPNMYLIRNRDNSSNIDFLVYLLNSDLIQSGLKNGINKTTQEKINKDNVKDLQILRPPLSEQLQIVEFLDEQTSVMDTTISKEERRIELLKEYRQSLISEVVTGKIKVTNDEQKTI